MDGIGDLLRPLSAWVDPVQRARSLEHARLGIGNLLERGRRELGRDVAALSETVARARAQVTASAASLTARYFPGGGVGQRARAAAGRTRQAVGTRARAAGAAVRSSARQFAADPAEDFLAETGENFGIPSGPGSLFYIALGHVEDSKAQGARFREQHRELGVLTGYYHGNRTVAEHMAARIARRYFVSWNTALEMVNTAMRRSGESGMYPRTEELLVGSIERVMEKQLPAESALDLLRGDMAVHSAVFGSDYVPTGSDADRKELQTLAIYGAKHPYVGQRQWGLPSTQDFARMNDSYQAFNTSPFPGLGLASVFSDPAFGQVTRPIGVLTQDAHTLGGVLFSDNPARKQAPPGQGYEWLTPPQAATRAAVGRDRELELRQLPLLRNPFPSLDYPVVPYPREWEAPLWQVLQDRRAEGPPPRDDDLRYAWDMYLGHGIDDDRPLVAGTEGTNHAGAGRGQTTAQGGARRGGARNRVGRRRLQTPDTRGNRAASVPGGTDLPRGTGLRDPLGTPWATYGWQTQGMVPFGNPFGASRNPFSPDLDPGLARSGAAPLAPAGEGVVTTGEVGGAPSEPAGQRSRADLPPDQPRFEFTLPTMRLGRSTMRISTVAPESLVQAPSAGGQARPGGDPILDAIHRVSPSAFVPGLSAIAGGFQTSARGSDPTERLKRNIQDIKLEIKSLDDLAQRFGVGVFQSMSKALAGTESFGKALKGVVSTLGQSVANDFISAGVAGILHPSRFSPQKDTGQTTGGGGGAAGAVQAAGASSLADQAGQRLTKLLTPMLGAGPAGIAAGAALAIGGTLLGGLFGHKKEREEEQFRAHLRALRQAQTEQLMNFTIVLPNGPINPNDPAWKEAVANTMRSVAGTRTGRVEFQTRR
jgi:hypothetical protein